MKELHDFPTSQLAALLAKETINYYKIVGYGASIEECIECNNNIKHIQRELELRRNIEDNYIPQRSEPSAVEIAA